MKHLDLTPYVKAEAAAGSVREALLANRRALGLFDAGLLTHLRSVGFRAAVVRDGLGYLDEIIIPLEAARRLRYVEGFCSGKN